ncbi:hypothetical protein JTB14_024351 [Gonioctena quinquepunctata]|nr:hypothetical protein JTB14_024351 [Gonioctena quinquepunctata]
MSDNPKYFVGLEINRKSDGSIFINQSEYIKQIVQKFGQSDAKIVDIPADPHTILIKVENISEKLTNIPYREAWEWQAVFLNDPSKTHWNAVKRIIRYLNATSELGIHYSKEEQLQLSGFSDSDYASDKDTRKSTTGYIFKLCNGAVTWSSKRQHAVTLSTTEGMNMDTRKLLTENEFADILTSEDFWADERITTEDDAGSSGFQCMTADDEMDDNNIILLDGDKSEEGESDHELFNVHDTHSEDDEWVTENDENSRANKV